MDWSLRQDPGDDTVGEDLPAPLLALGSGVEGQVDVVPESVLDDDGAGAVWVARGDRLDTSAAVGVSVTARARQDGGVLGHVSGVLGHHVVVDAETVGLGGGVDHDEPAAGVAAAQVRAIIGVGAQGPGQGALSPVLQRTDGEAAGLVPGRVLGRGPAFGHVLGGVGVLGVEVAQNGPLVVGGVALCGIGC